MFLYAYIYMYIYFVNAIYFVFIRYWHIPQFLKKNNMGFVLISILMI